MQGPYWIPSRREAQVVDITMANGYAKTQTDILTKQKNSEWIKKTNKPKTKFLDKIFCSAHTSTDHFNFNNKHSIKLNLNFNLCPV